MFHYIEHKYFFLKKEVTREHNNSKDKTTFIVSRTLFLLTMDELKSIRFFVDEKQQQFLSNLNVLFAEVECAIENLTNP